MGAARAIVMGLLLGVVGALPAAFLFERALKGIGTPSVSVGLASIGISFLMLSGTILAVWIASPDDVLTFGVSEVASFLLIWVIEAWRAWRDAQRGAGSRERNRGESTR